MQLISINLGQERPFDNKTGKTGIYKFSVSQPARIHPLGVEGDSVSDVHNHGGPDQAVYVYGAKDYAWWAQELGRDLAPGTFGENLTISELESADKLIGDCLYIGEVTLQVTAPRIPCSTFAARMGDPAFVKRFRRAGRPGLYCRVLQPGVVHTGDPVRIETFAGPTLTVGQMFEEFYNPNLDEAAIRRQLSAPVAIRARQDLEKQLAKLQAA